MKKKANGRKKIEIKKITDATTQLVTFSKRKSGLFKTASELSILCGADLAILVFSPKGKPFTFGHPNVNWVIARFLSPSPQTRNGNNMISVIEEALQRDMLSDLNKELNELIKELEKEKEKEKKRERTLDKTIKFELQVPPNISELSLHDLERLAMSMEELKKNVEAKTNELWVNELLNED